MRAKDRMHAFAKGLGALLVALLSRAIVVVVNGLTAFKLVTHLGIKSLVGGIAARKQRVAASRGGFNLINRRSLVRHLRMKHVVVEHHLAVRQRADRLTVFADIGNQDGP